MCSLIHAMSQPSAVFRRRFLPARVASCWRRIVKKLWKRLSARAQNYRGPASGVFPMTFASFRIAIPGAARRASSAWIHFLVRMVKSRLFRFVMRIHGEPNQSPKPITVGAVHATSRRWPWFFSFDGKLRAMKTPPPRSPCSGLAHFRSQCLCRLRGGGYSEGHASSPTERQGRGGKLLSR